MMTRKQIKLFKNRGFPYGITEEIVNKVIDETNKFLQNNDYEYFNLAILGNDVFRIMFRDKKTQKVEVQLFPLPS